MKTAKSIIKKRGWEDDCTPNYVSEIESAMKEYAKPLDQAINLILTHFPQRVLSDQMGADYDKFSKLIK